MSTHTTPDEFDLMDSRNSFAWNLLCELRERCDDPALVASSEILLASLTDPMDGAVVVWPEAKDLSHMDETAWGVDERGQWSDCYETPLVWCDQQDAHSLTVWYSAHYGHKADED